MRASFLTSRLEAIKDRLADVADDEAESSLQVTDKDKDEYMLSKVEDLDNRLAPLETPMTELTPSQDLEEVKRAVNELIKVINRIL